MTNKSDIIYRGEYERDFSVLLVFFVIVAFFLAVIVVYAIDNRKQPTSLDGWTEECVEYEIISHHIYVEKINDPPTTEVRGGRGRASYHSIGASDIEGYMLDSMWNETYCIKVMLVKNG